MKIMMPDDVLWDDHHHHSSLSNSFEVNLSALYQPNIIEFSMNFISIHKINSEKNLSNIK